MSVVVSLLVLVSAIGAADAVARAVGVRQRAAILRGLSGVKARQRLIEAAQHSIARKVGQTPALDSERVSVALEVQGITDEIVWLEEHR